MSIEPPPVPLRATPCVTVINSWVWMVERTLIFGDISRRYAARVTSRKPLNLGLGVLDVITNFDAKSSGYCHLSTMRLRFDPLAIFCLSLQLVAAQINDCQTTDLACHDIMNSSQCIEQVILEKTDPVTKEALVKCVEHEGTASNLPGAVKVWIAWVGSEEWDGS